MMELLKKYWWIVAIISIGLIAAYIIGNYSSVKIDVLPVSSADSLITINNNNIYFTNNKKLLSLPTKGSSKDINILDSDITNDSSSPEGNKIYYLKGSNSLSKSHILDTTTGNNKEYRLYDAIFWQNNDARFVEYNDNSASIYSEAGNKILPGLKYPSFISFAGTIYGSINSETPELQGYNWKSINSNNTIQILNNSEESAPWTTAKYLLYLDTDNKFNIINSQGKKTTFGAKITQNLITSNDGDNQYYISQDGSKITINSINLSNGQAEKVLSTDLKSIAEKNNFDSNLIKKAIEKDKTLYLLVDTKILRIKL